MKSLSGVFCLAATLLVAGCASPSPAPVAATSSDVDTLRASHDALRVEQARQMAELHRVAPEQAAQFARERELAAETERNRAQLAQAPSGGGLASFLGQAVTVANVVSDPTGRAYNEHVAANVPALAPLAQAANQPSSASQTASAAGGRGAVTPGSYPARPNTLEGSAACAGYTTSNYQEFHRANANGPDAQLHTLCAGAFNYYAMYLNAIRQGYSQTDSDRTYAAFEETARTATAFYARAR